MKKKHLGKKLITCGRCKGGFWADRGLVTASKFLNVVCPKCAPTLKEVLARHKCKCKCKCGE